MCHVEYNWQVVHSIYRSLMQAAEAEQLKLFVLRSWLLFFFRCFFRVYVFLGIFARLMGLLVCLLLLADGLVVLASKGDKKMISG